MDAATDTNRRGDEKGRNGRKGTFHWRNFLAVLGPGIIAMLADTDVGSLVTASQSGANWGYRLVVMQIVLVPVLYIVQELTLRIGAVSGKGHGALIEEKFGKAWGWVAIATLIVACVGALLTEFGGFVGVGVLMGVPPWATMTLVVGTLGTLIFTGSYKSVEKIALAAGAFEIAFVAVAIYAHPSLSEIGKQIVEQPVTNPKYLYLISANIGAVIMPWMVFYQQASVVEKGITATDIPESRLETAIGAVVTQLVMACVVIATAATLHQKGGKQALDTVQQIANALTPLLGSVFGKVVFGIGIVGAAFVASVVVTVTAARAVGEITSVNTKLDKSPREAPIFYGIIAAVLVAAALFVISGVDIVKLAVGVQVMNALLLTIVLGFLYLLARRIEEPYRLQGSYAAMVGVVMVVTVALGLYSGVAGLF